MVKNQVWHSRVGEWTFKVHWGVFLLKIKIWNSGLLFVMVKSEKTSEEKMNRFIVKLIETV